jgi:hypothetical protein
MAREENKVDTTLVLPRQFARVTTKFHSPVLTSTSYGASTPGVAAVARLCPVSGNLFHELSLHRI